MQSNGSPALILALTSDSRAPAQLFDTATKTLQQQLSQVEGVGEVEIGGSAMPAVRVEINPLSLYKYGIGFEDVRPPLPRQMRIHLKASSMLVTGATCLTRTIRRAKPPITTISSLPTGIIARSG
ncbi:MAG: efflux RND transporter permease subunit [Acetobacteraceae bacterium]